MSEQCAFNESDRLDMEIEREIASTQLAVLEANESKYHRSFVIWLFGLLMFLEVSGAVSLAYQKDYQKEHEKLINAIGYASIPIALTVGCCYAVAQNFGIRKEQERLYSKYRSILEREDV